MPIVKRDVHATIFPFPIKNYDMKKKLKTLAEHNGRSIEWSISMFNQSPQLNGIACPNCGEELYDTSPNVTLTSDPPQKNIGCNKCGYVGYRFC